MGPIDILLRLRGLQHEIQFHDSVMSLQGKIPAKLLRLLVDSLIVAVISKARTHNI